MYVGGGGGAQAEADGQGGILNDATCLFKADEFLANPARLGFRVASPTFRLGFCDVICWRLQRSEWADGKGCQRKDCRPRVCECVVEGGRGEEGYGRVGLSSL